MPRTLVWLNLYGREAVRCKLKNSLKHKTCIFCLFLMITLVSSPKQPFYTILHTTVLWRIFFRLVIVFWATCSLVLYWLSNTHINFHDYLMCSYPFLKNSKGKNFFLQHDHNHSYVPIIRPVPMNVTGLDFENSAYNIGRAVQ